MSCKLGFGYSVFETNKFDQTADTGSWSYAIAATKNDPRLRFVLDGHVYDNLVLDVSPIQCDGNLATGTVKVTLSNTSNDWNIFFMNKLYMIAECNIGLYFKDIDGIKYFFTGIIEDVEYQGPNVVLTLHDSMQDMMDTTLGSGQDPVDFYTTWWNPADMAWELLTEHGGLDDTQSAYNTDINYSGDPDHGDWHDWWSACHSRSYRFRAKFAGENIRTALLKIARLTNSLIWRDGEGKFNFRMIPLTHYSSFYLDMDNCDVLDMRVQKKTLKNYLIVYYGYDVELGSWEYYTIKANAASRAKYGTKTEVFDDRVVWHDTQTSAEYFALEFLTHWKEPQEKIEVEGLMPSFVKMIGQEVILAEMPIKQIGSKTFMLEKASYDLRRCVVEFEGYHHG